MLKYLRWRNTHEVGKVAAGFLGVAFDVSEQKPAPLEVCPWVPVARGQAGHVNVHTFQLYFRDWANEWDPGHRELLMGGALRLQVAGQSLEQGTQSRA